MSKEKAPFKKYINSLKRNTQTVGKSVHLKLVRHYSVYCMKVFNMATQVSYHLDYIPMGNRKSESCVEVHLGDMLRVIY